MTNLRCSADMATKRTRILLGCYRKGECGDPEVYVPAVAAVLSRYPAEVAKAVTDPVSGLPSWQDWLPTVAEVRRACESEAAKHYAALQPPPRRLAEPERTPEERERVLAGFQQLLADVADGCLAKPDRPAERFTGRVDPREAERKAAWAKAQTFIGQPVPKLSAAALKLSGVDAKTEAA